MTWNQRQIRRRDIGTVVTFLLVLALAALNGALYSALWGWT